MTITIWTLRTATIEAKKYKSRYEFQLKARGAYGFLRNKNKIKSACKHMIVKRMSWSLDGLYKEALKYKTKKEFERKSNRAYQFADRRNLINTICKHMISGDKGSGMRKWTKQSVKEIASTYLSRDVFRKENLGAYDTALRNGWLKEICSHMKYIGSRSNPEIELYNNINRQFPSATFKFFKCDQSKYKQNRFGLDIFIPEINKGIEFNGTYWHGQGFKRNWTNNPKEYHAMKKRFFSDIGIQYLEIWECDWTKNKKLCIKDCIKFLRDNDHD